MVSMTAQNFVMCLLKLCVLSIVMGLNPHLRDPRLQAAEIVETEGKVELKTTGTDMHALEAEMERLEEEALDNVSGRTVKRK